MPPSSVTTSRDCSTSASTRSEPSAPSTDTAVARSNPSWKTESHASARCSSAPSRSHDQAMTASSVRCRSGVVRSRLRRAANRSSSAAATSATVIVRTRAAASSTARGSPSSRSTTSRTAVGLEHGVRPRRRGALHEQLPGVDRGELAQRDRALGGQPQRRPAGGQHLQVAGRREQEGHQRGHRLEDVLAVVEDQQGRPRVELLRQPAAYVGLLGRGEREPGRHRAPDAEGRADRDHDVVARADADELDHVHAGQHRLARQHLGDAGLADAAGTEHRDQPGRGEGRAQPVEVLLAAQQPGRVVPHPGAHRVVGGQQLGVQPLQGGLRVDAEPLGQVGPVGLVARQRRGRSGGRGLGAQQREEDLAVVGAPLVRGRQVVERLGVPAQPGGGQRRDLPRGRTSLLRGVPQVAERSGPGDADLHRRRR